MIKNVLILFNLFILGCSFAKDPGQEYKNSAVISETEKQLLETVRQGSPKEVAEFLRFVKSDSLRREILLFEIAVKRGNYEVFSQLLQKGIFKKAFESGKFIQLQKKMNLDIRASITSQITADFESFLMDAKKETSFLHNKILSGQTSCASFVSKVFFLKWAQSELIAKNEEFLAESIKSANCLAVDDGFAAFLLRNELAYQYLKRPTSLRLLTEFLSAAKVSRMHFLAADFSWGELMISPLLVLRQIENESNKSVIESLNQNLRTLMGADGDIAYYLISKSGAYRVGHFSNLVELVSLEDHLIAETIQQNADFIFDRYVPVDQDIKLP